MTTHKRALNHYGANNQLDQAIEECGELVVAIRHYKRGRIGLAELADEVADVKIMMEQMSEFIGHHIVAAAVEKKISRLERNLNDNFNCGA